MVSDPFSVRQVDEAAANAMAENDSDAIDELKRAVGPRAAGSPAYNPPSSPNTEPKKRKLEEPEEWS
jgi:hypothetical protein